MPPVEHNPPMIPQLQAQTRPFVPPNTTNVLNDVCDPTLSLAAVAARYRTTVGAFCLWLERPDIADELAQIRSTCAKRAGFVASMHLPHYANSLAESLKQAVTESKCMTHFTLSVESSTLRVRYRENIRKTVALLHTIARFERRRAPKPPTPDPKPAAPHPRRAKSGLAAATRSSSAMNARPASRAAASQSRSTRANTSFRSAPAKPARSARPGSESLPRYTRTNSSPRPQSLSASGPSPAAKPISKTSHGTSAPTIALQQGPRSRQTLPGPAP